MSSKPFSAIQTNRSGRVRQLGSHERLLYLYSQQHPRHFCIAAELSGHLDPACIQLALQQLRARHPPLSLIIKGSERGPYFATDRRKIPVRLKDDAPSVCWQQLVEEELRTAFPTSGGPLMRLTLLSDVQNRERWMMILTFHHAIGDGLSGIAVLNDLVQLLNGKHLAALPQRPAIEALLEGLRTDIAFPEDVSTPVIPNMQLLREISQRPLWRDFATDQPRIDAQKFTAQETDRIVTACRLKSVTVQGALCAAVGSILANLKKKETATLVSPINVRRQAKVDSCEIGLFLSVGVVTLPVNAATSFWALARQYNIALASERSNEGIIAWLERLEQIITPTADSETACGLIGALAYDAVVSNLGMIQVDRHAEDKLRLSAIWGPCVLGPAER